MTPEFFKRVSQPAPIIYLLRVASLPTFNPDDVPASALDSNYLKPLRGALGDLYEFAGVLRGPMKGMGFKDCRSAMDLLRGVRRQWQNWWGYFMMKDYSLPLPEEVWQGVGEIVDTVQRKKKAATQSLRLIHRGAMTVEEGLLRYFKGVGLASLLAVVLAGGLAVNLPAPSGDLLQ